MKRKPNALVMIDPTELLFAVNKLKGREIVKFYTDLRMLLTNYPKAAIILTFNLRKRDRRAKNSPDLLQEARDWLEEVAGSIDILNRCDVRLGMDFQRDDVRVINGVRRGEEMHPLQIRPVGDSPEDLAGFEPVPPGSVDLVLALTTEQLGYWRKLPDEFRFQQVVDKMVPRSSLSRLIKKTKLLGSLVVTGGIYRKVVAKAL